MRFTHCCALTLLRTSGLLCSTQLCHESAERSISQSYNVSHQDFERQSRHADFKCHFCGRHPSLDTSRDRWQPQQPLMRFHGSWDSLSVRAHGSLVRTPQFRNPACSSVPASRQDALDTESWKCTKSGSIGKTTFQPHRTLPVRHDCRTRR